MKECAGDHLWSREGDENDGDYKLAVSCTEGVPCPPFEDVRQEIVDPRRFGDEG